MTLQLSHTLYNCQSVARLVSQLSVLIYSIMLSQDRHTFLALLQTSPNLTSQYSVMEDELLELREREGGGEGRREEREGEE